MNIEVPQVTIEVKKVKLTLALLKQMRHAAVKDIAFIAENGTAVCKVFVTLNNLKYIPSYVLATDEKGDYVLVPDERWTKGETTNQGSRRTPDDNELFSHAHYKWRMKFDSKQERDKYLSDFNQVMATERVYL